MTTTANIARLDPKDCQEFFQSVTKKDDGFTYYKNPITGRLVKEDADIYKRITVHCESKGVGNTNAPKPASKSRNGAKTIKNEKYKELIEDWIKNPLVNPKNGKKIDVLFNPDSDYREYYDRAYDYLQNEKRLSREDIKKTLPNKHYLFITEIDLLFYEKNKDIYSDEDKHMYEYMYVSLLYNSHYKLEKIGYNENKIRMPELVSKNEKIVMYYIIHLFAQCIAKYINCIDIILKISYKNFEPEALKLINTLKDLHMIQKFINSLNIYPKFKELFEHTRSHGYHSVNMHLNYIKSYTQQRKILYDFSLISDYLLSFPNIIDAVLDAYIDIFNTFNYKVAPQLSPFENIENKQFKEIKDPLLKVLEEFTQNGSIKDISLDTLEEPKRFFNSDAEYNQFKEEYEKVKSDYDKAIKEYNEKYESYKKKNKSSPDQDVLSRPKRPQIKIPNKNQFVMIGQQIPKHIPDERYYKMKEIYDNNKNTIELYKSLIDLGVLDLMKKSPSNDNKFIYENKDGKKKTRDYYENEVLDIGDENKEKCNTNIDILSQENLDDQNYLLSRLQLMFQLHTHDANNKIIRTDCFYAPNFYNYIVAKINNKESLLNPITKEPIQEEDINELMKIMKVIDPNIERPTFIKPIHDKKLKLEHIEVYNNKGQMFYRVYLAREFYLVKLNIFTLCHILADVETNETGSTDEASTVFLFSLYKLFNEGKLLNTYMPPYNDNGNYIKLFIHFNNFSNMDQWEKESREKQIEMFKHYLYEVKRYL